MYSYRFSRPQPRCSLEHAMTGGQINTRGRRKHLKVGGQDIPFLLPPLFHFPPGLFFFFPNSLLNVCFLVRHVTTSPLEAKRLKSYNISRWKRQSCQKWYGKEWAWFIDWLISVDWICQTQVRYNVKMTWTERQQKLLSHRSQDK